MTEAATVRRFSRFSRFDWIAAAVCAFLIALFGILAYSAVITKNATYDEPLHSVAGQLVRQHGDYRVDPEDGALFLRFSALLHGADAIQINTSSREFVAQREDHNN